MILTHSEYVARLDYGPRDGFNRDMAQTVASWWYSPGAPAMVAFVTANKIVPGLADEVDHELNGPGLSEADREDLTRLLAWVRENEVAE
jgi:hypothetical protein